MKDGSLSEVIAHNRLHRFRMQTLTVIAIGKKILLPINLLEPEEVQSLMFKRKTPADYKEYFMQAKKREPRVYNGNYASTINSFSMGHRREQLA